MTGSITIPTQFALFSVLLSIGLRQIMVHCFEKPKFKTACKAMGPTSAAAYKEVYRWQSNLVSGLAFINIMIFALGVTHEVLDYKVDVAIDKNIAVHLTLLVTALCGVIVGPQIQKILT